MNHELKDLGLKINTVQKLVSKSGLLLIHDLINEIIIVKCKLDVLYLL
jgi:hypothetical protein